MITAGYALIWLESLVLLLCVSAAVAFAFHKIQRTWLKAALLVLYSLLFLTITGCAVLYFYAMDYVGFVPPWTVHYTAALGSIAAALSILFFTKINFQSLTKPALAGAGALILLSLTIIGQTNLLHWENDKIAKRYVQQAMAHYPGPTPNEKNSYLVYKSLFGVFTEEEYMFLRKTREPDFNPLSEDVERLLSKHSSVLETMREASLRSGFYHPFNSAAMGPLKIRDIFSLSYFCGMAALYHAVKGDLEEAAQILYDMRMFANRINYYPGEQSFYVEMGLLRAIQDYEEHFLYLAQDLSRKLIPFLPLSSSALMQQKEMEMWIAVVAKRLQEGFDPWCYFRDSSGALDFIDIFPATPPIKQIIANFQLKQLGAYLEATKKEIGLPCTGIIERRLAFQNNDKNLTIYLLAENYCHEVMGYNCKLILCNGVGALAKAAWNYHVDKGQYPKQPETLVPAYLDEIPINPYTGKPLTIEFIEGGLTILTEKPEIYVGYYPNDFHMGAAYERYRLTEKN
ncbi:hypothetical protein Dalk_3214 [Desulfatibacillum aliphaticivorans]|uniref:Uncharacterized protein n=1 Tax=Desulfatibacillum aliphaticivorans TaxID=218208 RepID=B8FGJ5_DESAL|nr:hypothetical protein [Desulfatibacillum aliphaticivorans]ACL04904.1 hypothetical protein Dalk_3214 [Desulfatibacillum aliphaticivorans]